MTKLDEIFPKFFFDSNQWCGWVEDLGDLESVLRAHRGVPGWIGVSLLDAKRFDAARDEPNGFDSFGFRTEHKGPETLGEWLKKNWFQL